MRQVAYALAFTILFSINLPSQSQSGLDEALGRLKSPSKPNASDDEIEAEVKRFEAACKAVVSAGEEGAKRLDAELARTGSKPDEQSSFRIIASILLFDIRGIESAARVAEVWSSITDPRLADAVFFTAFKAARTQDRRALPLLRFCLPATESEVFVPQHSLSLAWPQTVEVLWNSCGQACLEELRKLLLESTNPAELGAAAHVLGHARWIRLYFREYGRSLLEAPASPGWKRLKRSDGTGTRTTSSFCGRV